uniref:Uncharacterized protein n=1 Tax=Romanomermis culicivorax TaxID=13658 RepID=A0A915K8T2_ROMCU
MRNLLLVVPVVSGTLSVVIVNEMNRLDKAFTKELFSRKDMSPKWLTNFPYYVNFDARYGDGQDLLHCNTFLHELESILEIQSSPQLKQSKIAAAQYRRPLKCPKSVSFLADPYPTTLKTLYGPFFNSTSSPKKLLEDDVDHVRLAAAEIVVIRK